MKGLFAGLLVVLTCATLAQQKQRAPLPVERENDELQEQRAEWFYGRRAFPLDHIPAGARLRALKQMSAMRSESRQFRPNLAISNTTWTSIGPRAVNSQGQLYASGRVSALVMDPRSADTVYLGGADGGVWKSTDGGKNWKALTDNQASLAIGALAIDLTNPDIVYAGTGDPNGFLGAGILKSTDAGNTWTNIPGPFEGSRVGGLVVHPTNGQILLAAKTSITNTAPDGIYRSTNGGTTWTLVQAGAGFSVTMDAAGNAFAALSPTIPATPNGGVFRSRDSGATWTAANGAGATALPWQNSGAIRMAVAPSNSAIVYVSLAAADRSLQGVYKTTDNGATWNALAGVPDYCKPQCNYSNVLGVHPTDPNVLYAGGLGAVRTSDGGITWSDVFADDLSPKTDIVHVDEQAIAFAAGGQRVYLGSDGGVNSTPEITSNSILWTNLVATLTLTQFYPGISIHPSDTTIGYGGTQDNSTERYSGNSAWDAVVCGDGGQTAIDFTTPSTVYAACTQTTIQKSTDGGETWTIANRGIAPGAVAFIAPLVMDPSNSSRLYFGTDVVNQTTNGAQTWTAVYLDGGFAVHRWHTLARQRDRRVAQRPQHGVRGHAKRQAADHPQRAVRSCRDVDGSQRRIAWTRDHPDCCGGL
jgi:photosystem II stability/assembly factor-like uncharacterized protein